MHNSPLPFHPSANGLLIDLNVTPKASANKIGDVVQDSQGHAVLKVYVTAVPDNGKANAAVIKLLAKVWRLPKTSLAIVKGATHRRKVIEITGDSVVLMQKIQSRPAIIQDLGSSKSHSRSSCTQQYTPVASSIFPAHILNYRRSSLT